MSEEIIQHSELKSTSSGRVPHIYNTFAEECCSCARNR